MAGKISEKELRTSLAGKINGKAEQSDLDSLSGVVSSLSDDIYALDNDVGGLQGEIEAHKLDYVSQDEVHGLRVNSVTGAFEYFNGTDWVTVSGGLPIGNLKAFTADAGNEEIVLKWEDPDDLVVDGITLAEWESTKIVRKTGSYPTDQNDGTEVVVSSVRDQYISTGFTDDNLDNDTEYFYMAFPTTADGVVVVDEANRVSATPTEIQIYGVRIDFRDGEDSPTAAVTYTDNAVGFTPMNGNNGNFQWGSWQTIFNNMGIKPCLFKNGAVEYYLDPSNFAKKADGVTDADITSGADGDVMIEFPRIYWKFNSPEAGVLDVQFSIDSFDGSVCLAHTRGSNVRNKVYCSAYGGSVASSKLRSLSGATIAANVTHPASTTNAQANGAGYEQFTFYGLTMLQVLYVVFFRSLDSQTALGRGYVDGNSATVVTGARNASGMFYGETGGKQQMKFCGVEDFWGNVRWWVDGLYSNASRKLWTATDDFNVVPYNWDGSTMSDKTRPANWSEYGGGHGANLAGYVKDVHGANQSGFVINSTSYGSASTYYCDNGHLYASRLGYSGGIWSHGDNAGAFYLFVYYSAGTSHASIAARLWFCEG